MPGVDYSLLSTSKSIAAAFSSIAFSYLVSSTDAWIQKLIQFSSVHFPVFSLLHKIFYGTYEVDVISREHTSVNEVFKESKAVFCNSVFFAQNINYRHYYGELSMFIRHIIFLNVLF